MLRLTDVVLDCPDTMKLARFYAAVIDGAVAEGSDTQWAAVSANGFNLAFQHVDNYRRPRWPEQNDPQQVHIDFEVDDFEAEGRRVVGLGATLRANRISESGYGFQVYIDPAGHPFCLCRSQIKPAAPTA